MKSVSILALAVLFLFSCKKKDDVAQPTSTASISTNPTTPVDSVPTNTAGNKKFLYSVANLDTTKTYDFSLLFLEGNYDLYIKAGNRNFAAVNTYFGNAGILDGAGKPAEKGKIWLNDSIAYFSETDKYYTCLPSMYNGELFSWKLGGDVGFPAQKFDMPLSLPSKIKLGTVLPDTIDSSQPFSLQITESVTNADSISFAISAYKDNVIVGMVDHFTKAGGTTSSNFSPSDLTYLKSLEGAEYNIWISAFRYQYGMLGTRKVLYVSQRSAVKKVVIK